VDDTPPNNIFKQLFLVNHTTQQQKKKYEKATFEFSLLNIVSRRILIDKQRYQLANQLAFQ